MKKGALIIAFFLFVMQSSLIMLLLKGNVSLQKYASQEKIEEKEEKVATDTLFVAPQEIHWENDEECWIDGKLYDIIHKTKQSDSLELIVYHDKKEQQAHKKYHAFTRHKSGEQLHAQAPMPDLRYQTLFLNSFPKSDFKNVLTKHYSPYHFSIIENNPLPGTPPPKSRINFFKGYSPA